VRAFPQAWEKVPTLKPIVVISNETFAELKQKSFQRTAGGGVEKNST